MKTWYLAPKALIFQIILDNLDFFKQIDLLKLNPALSYSQLSSCLNLFEKCLSGKNRSTK